MERSDVIHTSKGIQATHCRCHAILYGQPSLKTLYEEHIDRLLATEKRFRQCEIIATQRAGASQLHVRILHDPFQCMEHVLKT